MKEILDTLKNVKDSATGDDQIHYFMLKNLSAQSLEFLKKFYNIVYLKNLFPEKWCEAMIIPILKPEKNPTDPLSYRPISLISCLFKILDKIINKRLMWFLEKNSLIRHNQSGTREGRNTLDNLGEIATEIQHAFAHQKYHISIFLDLEKAYDTCWNQHLLQQLENFGMSGNLPLFIQHFVENRSIFIKLGNIKSDLSKVDLGIPQGSSLSGTLFIIAIDSVLKSVSNYIGKSLFVDDLRLSVTTFDLASAENKLQKILDMLQIWCDETGFSFSAKKSKILICHRKKRKDPQIQLYLNDQKLECVTEFKYLGLILDSKLTWKPHINYLKNEIFSRVNLLKIIASSKFKTNANILLNIHQAIILAKIEYGSPIFATAAPSNLKLLDPIHHKCLRICLGAFRTTPKESLYVESNIPSLETRRKIACMQFYFRNLGKKGKHNNYLFDTSKDHIFEAKKAGPYPLGFTIRKYLQEFDIGIPKIIQINIPKYPPWLIPEINICFKLAEFSKNNTSPAEFLHQYHIHKHESDIDFYTDGSKTNIGVGIGVAIHLKRTNQFTKYYSKLNKLSSIFFAELSAIHSALNSIIEMKNKVFTIFSDSKSSLQAIGTLNSKHEIVRQIHALFFKLYCNNNKITFCWIPGHCDIKGNEIADMEAKSAANKPRNCLKPIPHSDMKSVIKNQVYISWKVFWDSLSHNKLKNIGTQIDRKSFSNFQNRLEEIKFTRMRLGHTKISHSFILKNEDPTLCTVCHIPINRKNTSNFKLIK